MHAFIDTEPLYSYPFGGIPTYTMELLKRIPQLDELQWVSAYATCRNNSFRRIADRLSQEHIRLHLSRIYLPGRMVSRMKWLRRFFTIPPLHVFDLVHATAYVPPRWLNLGNTKLVITIHDLACMEGRQRGFVPVSAATDFSYLRRTLTRADAVICVSEFTKCELLRYFELEPRKIFVTHLGCDERFAHPDISQKILNKYHLSIGTYFLSVGTLSPRKNFVTLGNAFLQSKAGKHGYKLVIVGTRGWRYGEILQMFENHPDKIVWLDSIPIADMPDLYRGAKGFFLVSHYEGFGLPVLEAMQSAIPVCYSSGSSLEEVAGECGIQVAPEDVEAITNAFETFAGDDSFCERQKSAGRERSKMFLWDKTAYNTLNIYKKLLDL